MSLSISSSPPVSSIILTAILDGYYEGLRAQLTHMVKMGLCIQEKLENIHFAADLAEIKTILAKK